MDLNKHLLNEISKGDQLLASLRQRLLKAFKEKPQSTYTALTIHLDALYEDSKGMEADATSLAFITTALPAAQMLTWIHEYMLETDFPGFYVDDD
jgi:hypothetical protein